MKRNASPESQRSKRVKLDSDAFFNDENLSMSASHIYNNGTDGTGYISGKIHMAWPATEKRLLFILGTVCIHEGQEKRHRFDVCFSGQCAKFFSEIDLKPEDEVSLALKGARVEKTSRYTRVGTLPMKLHYEEGILMKRIRRGPTSHAKILDTWQPTKSFIVADDDDDWFSTPRDVLANGMAIEKSGRDKAVSEVMDDSLPAPRSENSDYSKSPPHSVKNIENNSSKPPEKLPDSGRAHVPASAIMAPAEALQKAHSAAQARPSTQIQPDLPVISKKKQKQQRKEGRKQLQKQSKQTETQGLKELVPNHKDAALSRNSVDLQGTTKHVSVASSSAINIVTPAIHPTNALNVTPSHSHTSAGIQKNVVSASSSSIHVPIDLNAGLRVANAIYEPLNNLVPRRLVNLIGVVASCSGPIVTRNGELMCSVRLIDPSNVIIDNFGISQEGFGINCFTKKYPQWLPCPVQGDVLILKNIKISEWNGKLNGVGSSGSFRWAVYSPLKGEIHHGTLGDAPERDGLADGFGYVFSPFFHPEETEVRYCLKMSDWWREVLKKREEALGEVHQIGGGTVQAVKHYGKSSRRQLCIRDAGPDVEPGGYFDCTVEVLSSFANDNGVHCIYVTDYTHNEHVATVQGKWCHPSLCDVALKIDMWDNAAEIGRTMKTGSYYSIQNIRMVTKPSGFVQGKLTEKKIHQLEEKDSEKNPFLRSLLERKKAWTEANESDSGFEHALMKDVVENKFFSCTVEIIHVDEIDPISETTCIYITDYTAHPSFLSTRINQTWSQNLKGCIVKVVLKEGQVHMVINAVGAYYSIKNLRLKYSVTGKAFQGFLGGNDRLIQRLNPRNTDNTELVELLRRKSIWKQKIETEKQTPRIHPLINSVEPTTLQTVPVKQRPHTSIKDIKATEICPNKFRVIARVVDFYPSALRDCMVAICRKCNKDIPGKQKACYECADFDHEYVQYCYQLFLLLEDNQGDQLNVSVNDDCPLLASLRRVDIRDDSTACNDLYQRIIPLLGNLIEVHSGEEKADLMPKTPILSLVINYWKTSEGERAYCLASYEGIAKSF